METVRLPDKPFYVTYKDFHTDKLVRIKRRPPSANHSMLPTDLVELKTTKNEDWREGDVDAIKHVSYRNPNVLQLENENGQTTFVRSDEVLLKEEIADRGKSSLDEFERNKYLLWP